MSGRGRRDADEVIAAALAAGRTVRDAAAEFAIAERTIHRRLVDPRFRARIAELRGEMVARALGRMAETMTEAADALKALLKAESEAVRLGAARSVIEMTCKIRETVELTDRIAALENAALARAKGDR